MKLSELFEQMDQQISAEELRTQARKAGEELFSKHRSGLIFDPDITVMTLADYIGDDNDDPRYDTFEYVFDPKTGTGKDLADEPVDRRHAKNGIIYVAGAHGIKVITLPGSSIHVVGDLKPHDPDVKSVKWEITDSHGYTYVLQSPRRGFPPLPDDPKAADKALEIVKRSWNVHHPVKAKFIEKE